MILRDKDANTAWTAASDATLEERRYSCQNFRHDVNHHRPHSSLGYLPPAAFAATLAVPPVGAAPLPPARPASVPMLTHRLS